MRFETSPKESFTMTFNVLRNGRNHCGAKVTSEAVKRALFRQLLVNLISRKPAHYFLYLLQIQLIVEFLIGGN